MKMVVNIKIQLFNKENLSIWELIKTIYEFFGGKKSKQNLLLNPSMTYDQPMELKEADLTKSQIDCISTQGIGNNDVIIRTKLSKLGNLRLNQSCIKSQIDLCIGFVCGKMDINSEKLRFNP